MASIDPIHIFFKPSLSSFQLLTAPFSPMCQPSKSLPLPQSLLFGPYKKQPNKDCSSTCLQEGGLGEAHRIGFLVSQAALGKPQRRRRLADSVGRTRLSVAGRKPLFWHVLAMG